MKLDHPAYVTITYPSGANTRNESQKETWIEITDPISGSTLCRVSLTRTCFANALASEGYQPAEMDFFPENFGKVVETKVEFIPASLLSQQKQVQELAVHPYEKDGWVARTDDYGNHHRRVKLDTGYAYRVTFTRYVDPTPEQREKALRTYVAKKTGDYSNLYTGDKE